MASVNKVILVGGVGADPDVRYLDRGQCISTFKLATTDRGYTAADGTVIPERTEWHTITLRRNLAEWSEKFIRKGMKIYVEGSLHNRTWEKDGEMRHRTEVYADNIQILYRPDNLMRPTNTTIEVNKDDSSDDIF